jgi:hypothetical protein
MFNKSACAAPIVAVLPLPILGLKLVTVIHSIHIEIMLTNFLGKLSALLQLTSAQNGQFSEIIV